MKILLLFNPVSGAGHGAEAAKRIGERLREAGHEVACAPTRSDSSLNGGTRRWLDPLLAGVDVLAVIGGDGAMRLAAPAAVRTGAPVYHLPFGTENLFAREFGMTGEPDALLAAIERFCVRRVDLGRANDRMFLLMASVGYDAEVVHDLACRRGASISHWSYLRPVFAQFRRWRPPVLSVTVDGWRVDDGGPGFVVIGNCKQYGWRLNPAGRASMSDGLLDVAYFPCRSRVDLLKWVVRCRLGRQFDDARLAYRTGREVTVSCAEPVRWQLDGDPPGQVHEMQEHGLDAEADRSKSDSERPLCLRVQVRPGELAVLMP